MEMICMNTKNSKLSKTVQFGLHLLQRLHLRSSNKHAVLQKL